CTRGFVPSAQRFTPATAARTSERQRSNFSHKTESGEIFPAWIQRNSPPQSGAFYPVTPVHPVSSLLDYSPDYRRKKNPAKLSQHSTSALFILYILYIHVNNCFSSAVKHS